MSEDWKSLFDQWSSKSVSKTDKAKSAYVPTSEQRSIMERAGMVPTDGPSDRTWTIGLIGTVGGHLTVSYYNSLREGANRRPETRMGREIVAWVEIGDILTIGRIGSQIFFAKESSQVAEQPTVEEIGRQLAESVETNQLFARASTARALPARRLRASNDFVRDPYVVAAALRRSNDMCEMPGCVRELFHRDDARPYLEVHHVTPLAEGGADILDNAAAICPACHRELHHGRHRMEKRSLLAEAILNLGNL